MSEKRLRISSAEVDSLLAPLVRNVTDAVHIVGTASKRLRRIRSDVVPVGRSLLASSRVRLHGDTGREDEASA